MTSVVFSDDEDVSKHASTLDNIHGIIVEHMKPCVDWESGCDLKENQPRAGANSSIENDPIYRQMLAEKRRPLGDVFILPMARPSKTQDEYQFVTDSEPTDDKVECQNFVESPSSAGTLISCTPLRSASRTNSRPASSTPRIYSRKRQRIRKLLDAELDIRSSQSDDDQEFVPELTVSTYESLCKLQPVLTMNLRPRKGLWTAEDDLPLSDIRQILYINGLESTSADSVTDICMTEKQKPQENHEADSCDEFAFLPSSSSFAPVEQLTPKRSRFTSSKGSSQRFECRHKRPRCDSGKGSRRRRKAFAGLAKTPLVAKAVSSDEDFRVSDDVVVMLSEVRDRCASLRQRRKLVDYSNMDLDL